MIKLYTLGSAVVALVLLLIWLLFSSMVQVDQGHVGLITQFGALTGRTLQPGLAFKNPLTEGVIDYDLRFQTIEVPVTGASRDVQSEDGPVALVYAIDAAHVRDLYSHVSNYQQLVEQQSPAPIKAALAQYSATQFLARRASVEQTALNNLNATLAPYYIRVSTVGMKDVSFSAQFNRANEEKVTAQQHLLQVGYEAQQQVIQATNAASATIAQADGARAAAIAAAQGEATALTLKGTAQAAYNRAVSASITPLLVQLTQAQRWNGVLPQYQIGAGAGTLFSLPGPATPPAPPAPPRPTKP